MASDFQAQQISGRPGYPLFLRGWAMLFSVLFHPLFIPVIVVAYLAYVQQGFYTGIPAREKSMVVARVAVNTIFFPMVTILLLKGLGFIQSVYLKTSKERIIPYVASNIFYFWIFLVFRNQPEVPQITTVFMLGIFLASSGGLVLNSFFKISMHGLGMSSFLGILLVIIFFTPYSSGLFLPFLMVVLLTGAVGTSRMILSDHTMFELNSGVIIGILSQVVAFFVVF